MRMDDYPKEEQLVDRIIEETAKWASKKYPLYPVGVGASMPGGEIRKLNLSLQSDHPLSKDELRKYLVEINSEIVKRVNSNEEIRPYLVTYPFTEKNAQILIFVTNKGYDVVDPIVCVGEISDGNLLYLTKDENNLMRYKNRYTETYEEALRFLKN